MIDAVVQCLSLLHGFAKYTLKSGSTHCRWRTKHWKCLVCKKDAKANINLVEVCKAVEVIKYFLNPKIENNVFG